MPPGENQSLILATNRKLYKYQPQHGLQQIAATQDGSNRIVAITPTLLLYTNVENNNLNLFDATQNLSLSFCKTVTYDEYLNINSTEKNVSVTNGTVGNETVTTSGVRNETVTTRGVRNETVTTGVVRSETVTSDAVKHETATGDSDENETVTTSGVGNETVTTGVVRNETITNSSSGNGAMQELNCGGASQSYDVRLLGNTAYFATVNATVISLNGLKCKLHNKNTKSTP